MRRRRPCLPVNSTSLRPLPQHRHRWSCWDQCIRRKLQTANGFTHQGLDTCRHNTLLKPSGAEPPIATLLQLDQLTVLLAMYYRWSTWTAERSGHGGEYGVHMGLWPETPQRPTWTHGVKVNSGATLAAPRRFPFVSGRWRPCDPVEAARAGEGAKRRGCTTDSRWPTSTNACIVLMHAVDCKKKKGL